PGWAIQLGLLAGAVAATTISQNLFTGALSLVLIEHAFPLSTIGFFVAITFIVQVVATPMVGPAVDRWGPMLALRLAPGLALLAALFFIRTSDPMLVAVARILQGFSTSLLLPAAFTMTPSLVSGSNRGKAIGLIGFAQSVGFVVGPQAGIWLHGLGDMVLFVIAASTAAIGLILTFVLAPPGRPLQGLGLFRFRA